MQQNAYAYSWHNSSVAVQTWHKMWHYTPNAYAFELNGKGRKKVTSCKTTCSHSLY